MTTAADGMRSAIGSTFAFYLKAHAFHWNVRGSSFPQLHALFEKIYEETWEAVDRLAEGLRTLGELAPESLTEMLALSEITEAAGDRDAARMVDELSRDNDVVIDVLTAALKACAACAGLANILQDRVEAHEKHGWMLEATAGR